jgi:hypothetical protein
VLRPVQPVKVHVPVTDDAQESDEEGATTNSRTMTPAALLLVLALGAAACDTAPDELTIRNESGQTLDVFVQTSDGDEIIMTTVWS